MMQDLKLKDVYIHITATFVVNDYMPLCLFLGSRVKHYSSSSRLLGGGNIGALQPTTCHLGR